VRMQHLENSARIPEGLRRPKHLSHIGILAIAVMLLCFQASAESCLLKNLPDETNKDELLEAYLDVAIDLNPCLSAGTRLERCKSVIQRHRSDYYFGLAGADFIAADVLQSVAKQINLTNLEVKNITGIQGYAKPKAKNESMMALVFISSKEATENPEAYFKNKLSWLNLGPAETMTSVLSTFLAAKDEGCITLNRDDLKGNILISTTWIKSDVPPSIINQCIARAVIGGLGLMLMAWLHRVNLPVNVMLAIICSACR
jgi:hypothetical protein